MSADKERLSLEINNYGGLWPDEQKIECALKSFVNLKNKREAIKCQLDFRRKVLGTTCDRSLYHISSGGKLKSIEELKINLIKIINMNTEKDSVEELPPKDFSVPARVDMNLLSQAKQKNLDEAEATVEILSGKTNLKGKSKKVSKLAKAPTKRPSDQKAHCSKKTKISKSNLPIISSPSDLIGKLVHHFSDRGCGEQWYKGVVLDIVSWSKQNPKYKIQYTLDDVDGMDISFSYLYSDFKQEKLELLEVTIHDFIDAKISHLYEDDESGKEKWWVAGVADVDITSKNQQSPDFFIYFDEEGEEVDEITYYEEPLLENYLNGAVRFLDCPSS